MNKLKLTVIVLIVLTAGVVQAARIKDIAGIGGVRENQLVGYGLVVGLMQTGDNVMNGFSRETISNMLSKQGVNMKDRSALVKAKNVASVMVTANLPPFARNGSRIDCSVSSMGDATSLQGGTLIMTPLRAADGEVYAVCQGGLSIGGFFGGRRQRHRHEEPDERRRRSQRCPRGTGGPDEFPRNQHLCGQSL